MKKWNHRNSPAPPVGKDWILGCCSKPPLKWGEVVEYQKEGVEKPERHIYVLSLMFFGSYKDIWFVAPLVYWHQFHHIFKQSLNLNANHTASPQSHYHVNDVNASIYSLQVWNNNRGIADHELLRTQGRTGSSEVTITKFGNDNFKKLNFTW